MPRSCLSSQTQQGFGSCRNHAGHNGPTALSRHDGPFPPGWRHTQEGGHISSLLRSCPQGPAQRGLDTQSSARFINRQADASAQAQGTSEGADTAGGAKAQSSWPLSKSGPLPVSCKAQHGNSPRLSGAPPAHTADPQPTLLTRSFLPSLNPESEME